MVWLLSLAILGCRTDSRCPSEATAVVCDEGRAIECADGRSVATEECGAGDICVPDAGCVTCATLLPDALTVPIDPQPLDGAEAWRTLGWRAVAVEGSGTAMLAVDGPFEAFDSTGALASRIDLPGHVFLRATAGGTGTLSVTIEGCGDLSDIALTARTDPGLTVTPRAAGVAASFVDAFPLGGSVRVGLDPVRYPDRIGSTGHLYVVTDRDRDAWLADPSLTEAAALLPRPVTMVDGTLADNLFEVWADIDPGPSTLGAFDVVIDWDDDGQLGPGDQIDGLDGPGFVALPDLSEPGPFTPRIDEVSASFFLTQRVYWPIEIDSFDTPAPLVVISHGNGHEYDWYDFLGEHLASWGYVVMSHRNDTMPGIEAAASTTLSNTDAFVRNHALIDSSLDGRIDVHRIVWIGHSRGGEGILVAHDRLRQGNAAVQALQADDIVLLSSIAPTVFQDPRQASPADVPYHMVTGGADGDVTGGVGDPVFPGPCGLCQWWRLLQGGRSREHVTYLHGAIHNDFNCCGVNDGNAVNAPKLGRIATHRYVKGLYLALLESELHGDRALGEVLRRMPDDLALPLPSDFAVATQSRIARSGEGLFLDDFQSQTEDPTVSSGGTAVRTTATGYLEGRLDDGNNLFAANANDPMNGMTQSQNDHTSIAARGAVLEWDGPATWEVDLPDAARDVSIRRSLSLRVAQATRHPSTLALGDTLAFGIGLVDGSGTEVVLPTAAYGRVTEPFERSGLGAGVGWGNEFNTIRVGMADFESLGLDLTDVRTVRLHFGPDHGSPVGRIGLDDVVLEDR
ncbi:MAG: hypothetical protein R3F61_08500 [Myxococcota bacterium]